MGFALAQHSQPKIAQEITPQRLGSSHTPGRLDCREHDVELQCCTRRCRLSLLHAT